MYLFGEELLTEPDPSEHQKQQKKKHKNRMAAQRSRQKHTYKADALHQQLELLEKQNRELHKTVQRHMEELTSWSRALREHACQSPEEHVSPVSPSDALAPSCSLPGRGHPASSLLDQQLPPDTDGDPGLLLGAGPSPSRDPPMVTSPSAQLCSRLPQLPSPASSNLLRSPPTIDVLLPRSPSQPLGQELWSLAHSPSDAPSRVCPQGKPPLPTSSAADWHWLDAEVGTQPPLAFPLLSSAQVHL